MGNKKFYGYKKPNEYLSEGLYESVTDESMEKSVGTRISISFHDDKFSMVEVNWGAEEDYERSRDGEVELNWYFDEENTKLLMLRTGTHNGKDLIRAISDRFKKYEWRACDEIVRFCEEKGISFSQYVHY